MLFNLVFANNTILSCFFFFLIPAFIAKVFNPIAELVILIVIPSKEAKAEIQMHPVTAEAKIRKCLI